MTGAQLAYIRSKRGWTLRQMADSIGDVAFSTIGRWELDPTTILPSWVEERIFRDMPVTLPLEDLHTLLDAAREDGLSFEQVIAASLKAYLEERKPAAPENVTPMPAPGLYDPSAGIEPTPGAMVAEPPAPNEPPPS